MYHDLLFVLSGFPGDIFQEHAQKNSYSVVKVATGLSILSPAEEAFLNRDILPLASHVLYLKRFEDKDPEIFKSQVSSFYLQALRNALIQLLDSLALDVEKLEQEILTFPQTMSLAKIHAALLEWYIPFETITQTIYNISCFSAKLIDQFITISDSSGNEKTKHWFKFLADQLGLVFENQTRELLLNQKLVDPYNEYFIKNISEASLDFDRLPVTVISKDTAKKISYICRTMFIIKNRANRNSLDDNTSSLIKRFSEEPPFSIKNATEQINKMSQLASMMLIEFIGSNELFDFFEVVRNLYFLGDSATWIAFFSRVTQPIHARKYFHEISEHRYENTGISFKLKETKNHAADIDLNASLLEQSIYVCDEADKYVAPVNDAWGNVEKNKSPLAKLSLSIVVSHPFNLIFDEWSMQRYNIIWRFLTRLTSLHDKVVNLRPLRNSSVRIWEIKRVINALQTYICSDVIEPLVDQYFCRKVLANKDFEKVVESHRQLLLMIVQQSFLLSTTLFSIFVSLLDEIDNFCEKSVDTEDQASYTKFKSLISVLFAMVSKRLHNQHTNKNVEIKYLRKFLLRLDYNDYFKNTLTKQT